MAEKVISHDVLEGLHKDSESGHYRVDPGYGHQAHRYKINETWLDEDDGLWIDGSAVEREVGKAASSNGNGHHAGK